ncbi:MAG TPA: SDR family oxidoreductase [Acidimicrobiia bacterium]|jgi:NAD(P)-dependent dehydrogenase (short-subunit alcohol dehydrogenase family)|nr:SDR family oxidoreductase [Acidimicrobiia bacterium]
MSDAAVALVTNGGYGVGREIVRSLDAAGLRVAVGARPGEFDNGTLKAPEEATTVHHGLLSSLADCARVINEVVEQHGRIDALVCNTLRLGLSLETPLERVGSTEWDRHVAGYLSGPFYLVRAALSPMLEQGYGRIVLVVPVEGGPGSFGQALMGVSSAGLMTLARRLSREVAGRGVTVNTVVAGIVEDRFSLDDMPRDLKEQVVSSVPAGRLGHPSEVADVVRYLCAPEAGFVTGQVIAVDGGFGA